MPDTQPTSPLIITHTFDAPAAQVWQGLTDPALVRQWWGPDGFSCPLANMDVREGGTSLLCMRAPASFGGRDYYNTWRYTRIQPGQRIELLIHLTDTEGQPIDPASVGMPPDFPQGQRHIYDIQTLPTGQTELTVTEYGWAPGQMRERSRMGMEQCLAKMARALAAPQAVG